MKYYTYKMKLGLLNILSIILFFLVLFITFCFTSDLYIDFSTIVVLCLWLVLHELLHGVGFLSLGKVKFCNVVFGMELEKGILYCMCKEKVSKLNILIALIFPLFFIGIVTYVIGLILNINTLIVVSIINIASSIGDIIMFLDILVMPKDIYYIDLDDTTSFTIIGNDLDNKKYFGLKLIDSGKYDNHVKAKDYTKLKISKTSIYISAILFILFIISILLNI